MPYQWLRFFLEDDAELADIAEKYSTGKLLTGNVKQRLIKCLQDFVKDFQERRKKVTDEDVKKFMSVRKIDAMPRAWVGANAAGATAAGATAAGASAAPVIPGAMTLYSDNTNFSSASIKIIADLCGISLVNQPLSKSPQKSTSPVLMVDGKALVGAPAITAYIVRLSGEQDDFLGKTPFEEAQVN